MVLSIMAALRLLRGNIIAFARGVAFGNAAALRNIGEYNLSPSAIIGAFFPG